MADVRSKYAPTIRHRVARSKDFPVERAFALFTGAFPDAQKGSWFPQGIADPGRQASPASDLPARYGPRALQSGSAKAWHPPLVHSAEAVCSRAVADASAPLTIGRR